MVQAGHAVERGTADKPQRPNAPKLYIIGEKWLVDFVLTEVRQRVHISCRVAENSCAQGFVASYPSDK